MRIDVLLSGAKKLGLGRLCDQRGGRFFAALGMTVLVALALALAPVAALADESWAAYTQPEVSAPAAILVERSTGKVLYEKSADEQRAPASTTKIMTALVVLENADLDASVTIESSDLEALSWDSSRAGLQVGETYTVRDLLACLLLPRGNDAAYALARYAAGSTEAFAELMNAKAAELGCTNSHFVNPSGLPADGHYSSARDLATIMAAALDYQEFVEIAGSASWDLPATELQSARTLTNTNALLDSTSTAYVEAAYAGKTGYTSDAGRCVVAAATQDTMDVVCVVLGADNVADANGVYPSFTCAKTLLEWGLSAWQTIDLVSAGQVVGTVDVRLSKDGETVDAVSDGALTATVPAEVTTANITYELKRDDDSSDEAFAAPIEEGAALGYADVLVDGSWTASTSVSAASEMRLSYVQFAMDWLSEPMHLILAIVVAVGVLVVTGILGSALSRRRRERRREKGKLRNGVLYNRAQVMTEVKPGHMKDDE